MLRSSTESPATSIRLVFCCTLSAPLPLSAQAPVFRQNWYTSLRHPVEEVSWEMCDEVLTRLGLVLPTEAQWEYACRAGTSTPWWTGKKKASLPTAANLADRFAEQIGAPASWPFETRDDGYTVHAPVGSFKANAFGLHDVHGNVFEWCRDWYGGFEIRVNAGDGERQVPREGARYRVIRGGGFGYATEYARSAYRYYATTARPGTASTPSGCGPPGSSNHSAQCTSFLFLLLSQVQCSSSKKAS